MLQIVMGGAKTGKTRWLQNRLTQICADPEARVLWLVPEQHTFEAEKGLFALLGDRLFRQVEVTGFTYLAESLFKQYGGLAGQYADTAAKLVLMEQAIQSLSDQLTVYAKSARRPGFAATVLETVTELKNACIEPAALQENAGLFPHDPMGDKLKEVSLIYAAYQALLLQTYLDPLDDLQRAGRLLQGKNHFAGMTVILDEFKGFTAAQLQLLSPILAGAREVILSLCVDADRKNTDEQGIFAPLLDTYQTVLRQARELGCKVAPTVYCRDNGFAADPLFALQNRLFSMAREAPVSPGNAVSAVFCKDEYDEVDYVLSTVSALVQDEGYRYGEIAILSRSPDYSRSILEAGFARYDIPYFSDARQPVVHKPLFRFVAAALRCAAEGNTTEHLLGLLKCGLSPFTAEEIGELENYCFLWDIKGRQWKEPFTAHPRGFQETLSPEDTETLARIDGIREETYRVISRFCRAMKGSGTDCCRAVVDLLTESGVAERYQGQMAELLQEGQFGTVEDYAQVWELLMSLLDTLAATLGTQPVTPAQFLSFFELALSSLEMGHLPQTMDSVTVGDALRVRLNGKRAVFVIGVNEGVFPLQQTTTGLFTEQDRVKLKSCSVELGKPAADRVREERFLCYKTLTSPTERLYLTCCQANTAGGPQSPSSLFLELRRIFTPEVFHSTGGLNPLYYCRSEKSAFSQYAARLDEPSPLAVSLEAVLSEEASYQPRLQRLSQAFQLTPFSIDDPTVATALFGKNMTISPTRVESFYTCRFRYFCEKGLKALPLTRAELNPLETGTLIHFLLQTVATAMDLKEGYRTEDAKALIKHTLDEYIERVMGGVTEKTKRFLYLYRRIRQSVLLLVERLHAELLQSSFAPCDFEFEIAHGTEVTPLVLHCTDGSRVEVAGKVDRIDRFVNKNGEQYIRIVDYKTGKKDFSLQDVLYGLNLQMLLYLHCITANGKDHYQDARPAGILYMPAGEADPSLPRNATPEQIRQARFKAHRMNGLLVKNRELLDAMETPLDGVFIPVELRKDETFTAASQRSLIELGELAKLNRYLERLVTDMAEELHRGRIEAAPAKDHSCDYCPYGGVCGIKRAGVRCEGPAMSNQEIIREMEVTDDA